MLVFSLAVCLYGISNYVYTHISEKLDYYIQRSSTVELDSKFRDSVWSCLYFTNLLVLQTYMLSGFEWCSNEFLNNNIVINKTTLNGFRFVNTYMSTYYISDTIKIFLNKDDPSRTEYLIHHIFTLLLILGGNYYNFHEFGMVISYIHHIADVILYFSKAVSYILPCIPYKYRKGAENINSLMFLSFGAIFIYTRLVLFNTVINYVPSENFTIKIVLRGLYCLHIYWSYLIVKGTYNILTGNKLNVD